jgi:hypothetical protein
MGLHGDAAAPGQPEEITQDSRGVPVNPVGTRVNRYSQAVRHYAAEL